MVDLKQYSVTFTSGLSLVIMVLISVWLFPTVLFKDLVIQDILIVCAIGYLIGLGVGIILIYFGVKNDINITGFAIVCYFGLLWLWGGEKHLGDIVWSLSASLIGITAVVTLLYSILALAITKLIK